MLTFVDVTRFVELELQTRFTSAFLFNAESSPSDNEIHKHECAYRTAWTDTAVSSTVKINENLSSYRPYGGLLSQLQLFLPCWLLNQSYCTWYDGPLFPIICLIVTPILTSFNIFMNDGCFYYHLIASEVQNTLFENKQ